MTPQVSVVIACRNAATTLGVQLEALARQECSLPWNVVISDNGSTDNSVALARSYQSRLPGLIIVDSSGRSGAGHARNVGATATLAPILLFCDADDEVAPGWLTTMVAAVQRHRFVAGGFESRKLNDAAALRSRPLQQSTGLQESPFGPDLPHAGAGNMGVTRSVFFGVGGFDAAVGCLEDTDLCWRIQLAGTPLVFCPEAVVHVRLRSRLSAMWAQGRAYGEAAAMLEHRFAQPPAEITNTGSISLAAVADAVAALPASSRTPPTANVPPASPVRDKARAALTLVRSQRSLGGLLWTVGWHVGHRTGPRTSAAVLSVPLNNSARRAS